MSEFAPSGFPGSQSDQQGKRKIAQLQRRAQERVQHLRRSRPYIIRITNMDIPSCVCTEPLGLSIDGRSRVSVRDAFLQECQRDNVRFALLSTNNLQVLNVQPSELVFLKSRNPESSDLRFTQKIGDFPIQGKLDDYFQDRPAFSRQIQQISQAKFKGFPQPLQRLITLIRDHASRHLPREYTVSTVITKIVNNLYSYNFTQLIEIPNIRACEFRFRYRTAPSSQEQMRSIQMYMLTVKMNIELRFESFLELIEWLSQETSKLYWAFSEHRTSNISICQDTDVLWEDTTFDVSKIPLIVLKHEKLLQKPTDPF